MVSYSSMYVVVLISNTLQFIHFDIFTCVTPFVIYILNWLGLDNENRGYDMQKDWNWSEQAPSKAEVVECEMECH
jgi:hypothetical protein